jgi:hypothetical protein
VVLVVAPEDAEGALGADGRDGAGGSGDRCGVWSKGISVLADGTVRSNEYVDVVRRRQEGWRVTHRTVRRRGAHQ